MGDAEVLRISLLPGHEGEPASMDIAAAFPSLTQRWGIQGCAGTSLRAIHVVSLSSLSLGGALRPLLCDDSGVAQARPLSGAIWALSFDPIVSALASELRAVVCGFVSACAGDL
eukprot:8240126-Pyramimonas_sp.AAC.1